MTTTIEIYCDDPSHEGRRRVVEVLARNEHGWHPAEWGKSGRKGAKSTLQFIKNPDLEDLEGKPLDGPDRSRYKFRCGLCGRSVTVRFERGKVVFDTLARNGCQRISLAGLAAIL